MLDFNRSFTVEHAVDDGAYHKLQRKLSYLLEFRGKLDEENWRAGVDVGLIFSYFKILLEFLMNQVTAWVTDLADVKDQLHSNQEDLRMTKLSLEESRCQVEKLRTENTILSTFVDQLTEEVESCQSDILDCRDALKNASMQSAVSKTEFQELYEQTFTLRVSLFWRLMCWRSAVTRFFLVSSVTRRQNACETCPSDVLGCVLQI